MRGFKAAEVLALLLVGACILIAVGVFVAMAYAWLFSVGDASERAFESLVLAGAGAAITVPVARAGLSTISLSRFRILMARHPEAYFEGQPYEARMLADEDLMRLAGKMAEMCRRYSSIAPILMEFLLAYEELIEEYEPGSSWVTREIRRLEETADRGLAEGSPKEKRWVKRFGGRTG